MSYRGFRDAMDEIERRHTAGHPAGADLFDRAERELRDHRRRTNAIFVTVMVVSGASFVAWLIVLVMR
jgi:hypothetical protein